MIKYKYLGLFVVLSMVIVIPIIILSVDGSSELRTNSPFKLVIDHDGGTDDAMAIFMALQYEQYFNGPELVALTTNHGNVYEDQVFNNTQRLLDIAKRRDVPIYRGANYSLVSDFLSDFFFGQDGLGDSGYHTVFDPIDAEAAHAAIALIELSKQYRGQLKVLTIGSLTNIALAVRIDPNFISRLSQLYVAAGHIHDAIHPDPEFNAMVDVEAYHIVAQAATPDLVTLVPFSQTNSSLHVPKEWRQNVLGAINTEMMEALNAFEVMTIDYNPEWDMLDPSAMSIVLNETLVDELDYFKNGIILCGDGRGLNTNKLSTREESNVKIVYSMKEDLFKQFLLDVFSAELKR